MGGEALALDWHKEAVFLGHLGFSRTHDLGGISLAMVS